MPKAAAVSEIKGDQDGQVVLPSERSEPDVEDDNDEDLQPEADFEEVAL